MNACRTSSARAVNARSQPRTVDGGRPSNPAIGRCPAPAALASSAGPITPASSAQETLPATPRSWRCRAQPHLASTPPPAGHARPPDASCRSTSSRSALTVNTGASARHPCGPPVSGAESKDGRAVAYTDVITVLSQTKKDNPRAALKHIRTGSDVSRPLHPQCKRRETPLTVPAGVGVEPAGRRRCRR